MMLPFRLSYVTAVLRWCVRDGFMRLRFLRRLPDLILVPELDSFGNAELRFPQWFAQSQCLFRNVKEMGNCAVRFAGLRWLRFDFGLHGWGAVTTEGKSAADLIERIASRDRQAFSDLYDRFSPLVYSLGLRMLKVREDADDLVQEVFIQLWRQAANYNQDRGSPEAWIVNITRTRAIDKLRANRRIEKNLVPAEDPARSESAANVESAAAESEARLTMNTALAALPEPQRRVLELAYFDGLTQTEIAARLAGPLGTVKTRVRSGIQKLREILGAQSF